MGARPSFERPAFERPAGDRPPFDRPAPDRPFPDRAPADRAGRPGGFRQPSREWSAPSRPQPRPFGPEDAVPTAEQLGPDEELVAGRRPVEEAFAARRPARRLLVTPQRRFALEQIVLHATTLRIPIVEVEGGTLTALSGFDGHQGVALVVEPRVFASLDEILARAIERGEPPFVLVLDSLEDPQNLGTVLRSAEAAGAHGVIFPTARQAPLSPAAIKASAGATEHLLLCPVDDLAAALADLHVRGLRVIGTEAEAPLTTRQADLRGPIAIVIGSEGHGLSPTIRRRCDLMVRIPMRGRIGSLNAAVAGSVLLFEALGQRDPEGRPVADGPVAAPRTASPARGPKRRIRVDLPPVTTDTGVGAGFEAPGATDDLVGVAPEAAPGVEPARAKTKPPRAPRRRSAGASAPADLADPIGPAVGEGADGQAAVDESVLHEAPALDEGDLLPGGPGAA
jgi:23S rRNA (guanosine2251-2'-O)-methyltransferase